MRHWNQDQDFMSNVCTFWKSNFLEWNIYIPLQRLYCLSVDNFLAKFEHWYELNFLESVRWTLTTHVFIIVVYYCCLFSGPDTNSNNNGGQGRLFFDKLKGAKTWSKENIWQEILVNSNSSIFLSSDFWQVISACRGNGSPELKVRHSKFCQIVAGSTSLPDWTDKVLISDPLVS